MEHVLIYHKHSLKKERESCLFVVSDICEAQNILETKKICLILIHLEKGDREGMHLAMRIREMPDYFLTPIIFLAWDESCKNEAFHTVHCYDYLVKPLCEFEMINILYPYIRLTCVKESRARLSFRIRGNIHIVNVSDIIYMQCANRQVEIYTTKGILEVPYLNLQNCLCQCSQDMLRCHRSIAVNRQFIRKIDFARKKIVLCGAEVDMGRHYVEVIRSEYEEELSG